jgi:hypothetical protein
VRLRDPRALEAAAGTGAMAGDRASLPPLRALIAEAPKAIAVEGEHREPRYRKSRPPETET